jgi:tRNA U34 5-carboxymethylaminomethyl modifying enzyme MnmG/GidA
VLGSSKDSKITNKSKHHIIQSLLTQLSDDKIDNKIKRIRNKREKVNLNGKNVIDIKEHNPEINEVSTDVGVRYVRLLILSPATQWGVSIWRFQLWGTEF